MRTPVSCLPLNTRRAQESCHAECAAAKPPLIKFLRTNGFVVCVQRRISECYGPLLQLVKGLRNPEDAQDALPAELIQNPLARQQRLRQLVQVRGRGQAEASVSNVGWHQCLQTRCRGGQSSFVVTVSPVTVERQAAQGGNDHCVAWALRQAAWHQQVGQGRAGTQ